MCVCHCHFLGLHLVFTPSNTRVEIRTISVGGHTMNDKTILTCNFCYQKKKLSEVLYPLFLLVHCFFCRLMCTVLVFFCVRFAPGNSQTLNGVKNKLLRLKTVRFELLLEDVCIKILKRDPVWKTSFVNYKNSLTFQSNGMNAQLC